MRWFANMMFNGKDLPTKAEKTCSGLFSQHKLLSLIRKAVSRVVRICSNSLFSVKKFRLHAANSGVILLEFAVCMPVLIILLFYINDLVKIKRLYSQSEFVAQQMANIIQNISQKRAQSATTSEERANLLRITADDLKYAIALAYQTIYPGTTMFAQEKGYYFVHVPHPMIYYVEGNENGTATTVWRKAFWTTGGTPVSPAKISHETSTYSHDLSKINMGTDLQPSQIYPTLKIGPGDQKIIIESLIFLDYTTKDINGKSGYTPKDMFGCRLVTPKRWNREGRENRSAFFNSVVIFTPKSRELFNETAP